MKDLLTQMWLRFKLGLSTLALYGLGCIGLNVTLAAEADVSPKNSLFFGMQADRTAPVSPLQPVSLPRDHAPHWDYQIEWWYFTFLLNSDAGEPFNYQFTLFKIRQPDFASNWGEPQIWMAHSSLHTKDQHWFNEKFAQQGVGNAGFIASPLQFYIDNWELISQTPTQLFPLVLKSTAGDNVLNLNLHTDKPFVFHGDGGVSNKTADGKYRSYYYSQPFIQVDGQIHINNEKHSVSGVGWYDHEWTSQLADDKALGWDWFSLHFDDGMKLMAFTMHVDGKPSYSTGTLIKPDGSSRTLTSDALALEAFETASVAGRDIPVRWHISLPEHNIEVTTDVFKNDQWNPSRFPYYEGAIRFSGSHSGKGYMELTGY